MMGPQSTIPVTEEGSTLTIRGQQQTQNDDNRPRRGRPWCDHCRKSGHTKEICWKIHGKPVDQKPSSARHINKDNHGNTAFKTDGSISTESAPFSKEQIKLLQKMFGQSLPTPTSSATLAQSGNPLKALSVKQVKRSWFVDSGASDHMTIDASLLMNLKNCQEGHTIKIANGSISKVTGIGSAKISNSLILNSFLLVPTIDCNFLSNTKLTHEENCIAIFVHNLCEFQDLDLGKTIGSARECSGLYLLEGKDLPERQVL